MLGPDIFCFYRDAVHAVAAVRDQLQVELEECKRHLRDVELEAEAYTDEINRLQNGIAEHVANAEERKVAFSRSHQELLGQVQSLKSEVEVAKEREHYLTTEIARLKTLATEPEARDAGVAREIEAQDEGELALSGVIMVEQCVRLQALLRALQEETDQSHAPSQDYPPDDGLVRQHVVFGLVQAREMLQALTGQCKVLAAKLPAREAEESGTSCRECLHLRDVIEANQAKINEAQERCDELQAALQAAESYQYYSQTLALAEGLTEDEEGGQVTGGVAVVAADDVVDRQKWKGLEEEERLMNDKKRALREERRRMESLSAELASQKRSIDQQMSIISKEVSTSLKLLEKRKQDLVGRTTSSPSLVRPRGRRIDNVSDGAMARNQENSCRAANGSVKSTSAAATATKRSPPLTLSSSALAKTRAVREAAHAESLRIQMEHLKDDLHKKHRRVAMDGLRLTSYHSASSTASDGGPRRGDKKKKKKGDSPTIGSDDMIRLQREMEHVQHRLKVESAISRHFPESPGILYSG